MKVEDYREVVGDNTMQQLYEHAEKLKDKHLLCINSTYQGGGVAEMLNSVVFLFNDLDIQFGWRVLHGSPDFFTVTKKIHNALQGDIINFSKQKRKVYHETNARFAKITHIVHDLVLVHDPQPLPMIEFYEKKQPWIWRGHIDLEKPNKRVWKHMRKYMNKYDEVVVSRKQYTKKKVKPPQSIIYPAIDPLSPKNKHINKRESRKFLKKHGIKLDKPIISQVSRFDKWKDPIGVIKVFEKVRKKVDCRLVLLGSLAADDPEGQEIFQKVDRKVEKSEYKRDIQLVLVENNVLVNCLQRESAVVIQKSLREGFGLTVSEALYKKTPVVSTKVGGIPLQVIDGVTGFLHKPKSYKKIAESVVKLLKDEDLRKKMGEAGHEHVKENFLITRLMLDWMKLFEKHLLEDNR